MWHNVLLCCYPVIFKQYKKFKLMLTKCSCDYNAVNCSTDEYTASKILVQGLVK